jgi:LPXTG-motif cell wall-anchored protein
MAFIITSIRGINPDYLIFGAAAIIAGGVALWWRRRR